MNIGIIVSLAGAVGLAGSLIWLIVRIVGWDSKWPALLVMVLCMAMIGGGLFFAFKENPDLQIPFLSDLLQKAGISQDPEDPGSKTGLLNVAVTVPEDFLESPMTQAQLDEKVRGEKIFVSATVNGDGSVTYVMNRLQHWKLLWGLRQEIDRSLLEMAGSRECPNFVSIKANGDYTEYTVTVSAQELSPYDTFAAVAFYTFSDIYHAYSRAEVDNVHVQFVNESSGEVMAELNSQDAEDAA